jgi:hypothetical protein
MLAGVGTRPGRARVSTRVIQNGRRFHRNPNGSAGAEGAPALAKAKTRATSSPGQSIGGIGVHEDEEPAEDIPETGILSGIRQRGRPDILADLMCSVITLGRTENGTGPKSPTPPGKRVAGPKAPRRRGPPPVGGRLAGRGSGADRG